MYLLSEMKKLFCLISLSTLLVISSCKKNDDTATPVISYFLQATIDGQTWKANTSLFADKAIVMTINGINQQGSSLTLELDDFTPGTYQIKNSRNHIIYTSQLADAFESTDGNPGTLVITSNDESKNLLKGTFTFTGQSPLSGNKTISNGSFEVFYTE